jgi:hypothetical protein
MHTVLLLTYLTKMKGKFNGNATNLKAEQFRLLREAARRDQIKMPEILPNGKIKIRRR